MSVLSWISWLQVPTGALTRCDGSINVAGLCWAGACALVCLFLLWGHEFDLNCGVQPMVWDQLQQSCFSRVGATGNTSKQFVFNLVALCFILFSSFSFYSYLTLPWLCMLKIHAFLGHYSKNASLPRPALSFRHFWPLLCFLNLNLNLFPLTLHHPPPARLGCCHLSCCLPVNLLVTGLCQGTQCCRCFQRSPGFSSMVFFLGRPHLFSSNRSL